MIQSLKVLVVFWYLAYSIDSIRHEDKTRQGFLLDFIDKRLSE